MEPTCYPQASKVERENQMQTPRDVGAFRQDCGVERTLAKKYWEEMTSRAWRNLPSFFPLREWICCPDEMPGNLLPILHGDLCSWRNAPRGDVDGYREEYVCPWGNSLSRIERSRGANSTFGETCGAFLPPFDEHLGVREHWEQA